MDDMTAFERQVAAQVMREMRPSRPVDATAVIAAVDAARSRSWRFQSMFSATRFVVAGAIVALFGGLLLVGALTTRPTDDQAPAVGASASASAEPEPSGVTVADQESAVEARETTTDRELLPGVALVTEAVEPGVYRVVNDGVRELGKSGLGDPGLERYKIVAGYDGSVWEFDPNGFFRIGDADSFPADEATRVYLATQAAVDPEGVLWAILPDDPQTPPDRRRLYSFSDGEWRSHRGRASHFAMQPDGTVWVIRRWPPAEGEGPTATLERLDPDGWTVFEADDLAGEISGFWVGPGNHRARDQDGNPQEVVDYLPFLPHDGQPGDIPSLYADVGAGGDTWEYQEATLPRTGPGAQRTEQVPYLVRKMFSGGVMGTYGPEQGVPLAADVLWGGAVVRVGPDGRVWMTPASDETDPTDRWSRRSPAGCDGVAGFDGSGWTHHLRGLCVFDMDVAPDGSVWLLTADGVEVDDQEGRYGDEHVETYVITPEAVASSE